MGCVLIFGMRDKIGMWGGFDMLGQNLGKLNLVVCMNIHCGRC